MRTVNELFKIHVVVTLFVETWDLMEDHDGLLPIVLGFALFTQINLWKKNCHGFAFKLHCFHHFSAW